MAYEKFNVMKSLSVIEELIQDKMQKFFSAQLPHLSSFIYHKNEISFLVDTISLYPIKNEIQSPDCSLSSDQASIGSQRNKQHYHLYRLQSATI